MSEKRPSIKKTRSQPSRNKIQKPAGISEETQGHVASILFLSTCFAVGLFSPGSEGG